jgi:hypothetical protein
MGGFKKMRGLRLCELKSASFPSVFKEGWPRDQQKAAKLLRRADGVVSNEPRSAPYLLMEFTNRPVYATKERDLFISGAATPPCKGGECRLTRICCPTKTNAKNYPLAIPLCHNAHKAVLYKESAVVTWPR